MLLKSDLIKKLIWHIDHETSIERPSKEIVNNLVSELFAVMASELSKGNSIHLSFGTLHAEWQAPHIAYNINNRSWIQVPEKLSIHFRASTKFRKLLRNPEDKSRVVRQEPQIPEVAAKILPKPNLSNMSITEAKPYRPPSDEPPLTSRDKFLMRNMRRLNIK